ncbi:MAG: hypothetical protein D3926_18095 [Desulfobacteraceae bacterium]|nr:MAG: hypothetical protein D3926_18095 [Desulfobacteraceae bacterium]
MKKNTIHILVLVICCLFGAVTITGAADKDMGGWGVGDKYNSLYNAVDVEDMKVKVLDVIEVTPLPGMSPGVGLVIEDEEGDEMVVHVCPAWYKRPEKVGVRKGDKIKLRGVYAEINGEDVIMAAKIKGKSKTLKVRLTSDGTPFWTMSPAQLQKELSSQ